MSLRKFQSKLTDRAKSDILKLLSYTAEMWGERQAYEYKNLINKALAAIEQILNIGYAKADLNGEIMCFSAGRHLLFYKVRGQAVHILRVLHDSMDYARHVNDMTHEKNKDGSSLLACWKITRFFTKFLTTC